MDEKQYENAKKMIAYLGETEFNFSENIGIPLINSEQNSDWISFIWKPENPKNVVVVLHRKLTYFSVTENITHANLSERIVELTTEQMEKLYSLIEDAAMDRAEVRLKKLEEDAEKEKRRRKVFSFLSEELKNKDEEPKNDTNEKIKYTFVKITAKKSMGHQVIYYAYDGNIEYSIPDYRVRGKLNAKDTGYVFLENGQLILIDKIPEGN